MISIVGIYAPHRILLRKGTDIYESSIMWCSRDLQDQRVYITSILKIVAGTVSDSKAVPCNFEDAIFMEISDSKHHGCLVCNS